MPGVAGVGGTTQLLVSLALASDITNTVHNLQMIPTLTTHKILTLQCAALLPGGDPAEVLVGAGEGVWCGGGGHGHYSSGARLLSSPRHSVVFEAQRMTMGCHNHQEV